MNAEQIKAKLKVHDARSKKIKQWWSESFNKFAWFGISVWAFVAFNLYQWFQKLKVTDIDKFKDVTTDVAFFIIGGWVVCAILGVMIGMVSGLIVISARDSIRNRIIKKLAKAETFEGFITDCREARK